MREGIPQFIGAEVRRREDPALVTGQGKFVGDIVPDGQMIASDFNEWLTATKAIETGYVLEDCNLDFNVTASDFNLWLANTKAVAASQVPD